MKIHVHKVVQMHNCSYERIYFLYGKYIDEKGMIDTSHLN